MPQPSSTRALGPLAAVEHDGDGCLSCWFVLDADAPSHHVVRVRVVRRTSSGVVRALDLVSTGADVPVAVRDALEGARSGPGWVALEARPDDVLAVMEEVVDRRWSLDGMGMGGRDVTHVAARPEQVPRVLQGFLVRVAVPEEVAERLAA